MDASTLEILDLTPIKTQASTTPRKRKITPSPELSSSSKRTIVLKSGLLLPAHVVESDNHVLLSPSRRLLPKKVKVTKTEGSPLTGSRHIILDFDLQKNPDFFFEDEAHAAIEKLFPGAKEIAYNRVFLMIQFDTLPPKPWPFTVAGIPCYFTTVRGDGPVNKLMTKWSHTKLSILEDIDASALHVGRSTTLFDENIDKVFEYFEKTNIKVKQVQNWKYFIVLVLPDKNQANSEHIPRTIMKKNCFILFDDDLQGCRQPALRLKEPKIQVSPEYDDESYDTLRPGIMLTSENFEEIGSLTTTAGVMVQKDSGPKLLTVAAHGFPNMGVVHHPRSNGRIIGTIAKDFSSRFDISLVKLDSQEKFVNETFDSVEGDDGGTLTKLAPLKSLLHGDIVSMNNPFVGRCDASLLALTYDRHVLQSGNRKSYWLQTGQWFWTGQESSLILPDGICGTPIVKGEDEVLGFFRFVGSGPWADCCYATAAENLLKEGYQICQE